MFLDTSREGKEVTKTYQFHCFAYHPSLNNHCPLSSVGFYLHLNDAFSLPTSQAANGEMCVPQMTANEMLRSEDGGRSYIVAIDGALELGSRRMKDDHRLRQNYVLGHGNGKKWKEKISKTPK